MTLKEILAQLQTADPGYWAWLQARPQALEKVRQAAREAADANWKYGRFENTIHQLKSYENYTAKGATAPDEEVVTEVPPDEAAAQDTGAAEAAARAEAGKQDIRDLLRGFLVENELPETLMGWVEGALAQGWNADRIIYELRKTPEYKAAYPENEVRAAKGFDWMPEAEIRAYRSEARRLSQEYYGYNPSNAEIADLITRNKSLVEYERNLQDYFEMEKYGDAVNQAFQSVLGYQLDEDRLWDFFSRDVSTPELDRAYELSRMMGQPAALGFGIRPEQEAEILRSYGINPEEAFRGYQQMATELPRAERLAAIEAEIARMGSAFPNMLELPFTDLFKAIQLGDADTIMKLQQQVSREVARWKAGGGPTAKGLLAPEERR